MHDLKQSARRISLTLFSAQSLASAGFIAAATLNSILGARLGGQASWAGVPPAVYLLGSAGAAFLWGYLMEAWGRRLGLLIGLILGTLGAGLAFYAIAINTLLVFLAGMVLMGMANAAVTLGRFAAAEVHPPGERGRAISNVVLGGAVGAILGPLMVGPMGRLAQSRGFEDLSGAYATSGVLFALACLAIFVWLRPDPRDLGREVARLYPEASSDNGEARSIGQILRLPAARVAINRADTIHIVDDPVECLARVQDLLQLLRIARVEVHLMLHSPVGPEPGVCHTAVGFGNAVGALHHPHLHPMLALRVVHHPTKLLQVSRVGRRNRQRNNLNERPDVEQVHPLPGEDVNVPTPVSLGPRTETIRILEGPAVQVHSPERTCRLAAHCQRHLDQHLALDDIQPIRFNGKVTQVVGLVIEGFCPDTAVGSTCEIFPQGGEPILAEVVGFRDNKTLLMPLGELRGVGLGSLIAGLAAIGGYFTFMVGRQG